jgi:outer membrane protein W
MIMKRFLTVFAFIFLASIATKAQEFKKFKVGIGAGYAMASGKGAKGGVLLYLEPAYRITDVIQLGLRMESAVVARGFSEDPGELSMDVAGLGSYTLNGQYYFSNNSFRPFIGAGVGIFTLAAVSMDIDGSGTSQDLVASSSKIGFYPRAGFDFNHFTLSLDYNIVPETDGVKNSYIGIRFGGFFGGGRK